ncbi:hypothetical protein BDR26DRAFT_865836 [Obelidium mucronatum]|nr:hypothetical protein BDR26DRAFT_865836 [Obelidium mucronatum]
MSKRSRIHEAEETSKRAKNDSATHRLAELEARRKLAIKPAPSNLAKEPAWRYLHIQVTCEGKNSINLILNQPQLSLAIADALTDLFGVVGGAKRTTDVIFVNETELVLRTLKEYVKDVQAALTLAKQLCSRLCRFSTIDIQPSLLSLDSISFLAPSNLFDKEKIINEDNHGDTKGGRRDADDTWVIGHEIAELCHWNSRHKSGPSSSSVGVGGGGGVVVDKPILDVENMKLEDGADVLGESALEAVKLLLAYKSQ